MKIKKASPGLDQRNRLGRLLGDGYVVHDFDAARPLAAQVADADVLLVRDVPITREVIDAAPRLKLIQRPGDHLPRIDLEYARAKGIPDWIIRDRHAARNAMLPVTTSLVLALAFVIGGGIVTETIFSWPGMGLVFLQAINVSDIPLAVGALAITGVLALFGHLIADILYVVLDPRIRIA